MMSSFSLPSGFFFLSAAGALYFPGSNAFLTMTSLYLKS